MHNRSTASGKAVQFRGYILSASAGLRERKPVRRISMERCSLYKTKHAREPRIALQPGRITRGEWLRFMSKVVIDNDSHWVWQRYLNADGYGFIDWRGQRYTAHTFAYIALKGPVSRGFEPDHLCRVRACVNPDHLEVVSQRINNLRSMSPSAINARKIVCKQGHPFNEGNTYIRKTGGRTCITCLRERTRLYRHQDTTG